MIAGSRIIDARHHPFDVMFGSALGLLCGWGAYRQYFPPVSHTWEKGRAFPARTWGVTLRRPDGVLGTDGNVYGYGHRKVDRAQNAMADDEEDRHALVGMEPMRGDRFDPASAPAFQSFQQRGNSPALRSGGSDDDMDYEHVRVKAGNITTMPSETLTRDGSPKTGTDNNAFRQQVQRNESFRTGQDDSDLAHQKPTR